MNTTIEPTGKIVPALATINDIKPTRLDEILRMVDLKGTRLLWWAASPIISSGVTIKTAHLMSTLGMCDIKKLLMSVMDIHIPSRVVVHSGCRLRIIR